MTKRLLLQAVFLCVAVVATGCGGGRSSDEGQGGGNEPFVIGAATAQTGAIAPFDQPAIAGLEVAIEEINAEGGLDGSHPVELNSQDTRSDAAQTAVAAQELIDEGADLLVVPCDGDLALAGGPVGQDAGIPTMSICSSVPILPDEIGDYYFGNSYGDNAGSAVLAKYAIDEGYKTGYWLNSPDTVYTDKVPEYWGEAFENLGGEVVGNDSFTVGQQNFSAIATRISQISPAPDVIMTSAYEPDFPAFIRQLRAAGVDTPVLGSDGIDTPTILELGQPVEGLVHNSSGLPEPGTPLGDFYDTFEQSTGSPPESVYSAVGADLIKVLDAAVASAGSTEPQALRDAIAELEDVEGYTGPITYAGTNGTPIKQITLVRIEDGKRVLVDRVVPSPKIIPEA
jgi:branched-chain amino acid transport system substrate-binding protein